MLVGAGLVVLSSQQSVNSVDVMVWRFLYLEYQNQSLSSASYLFFFFLSKKKNMKKSGRRAGGGLRLEPKRKDGYCCCKFYKTWRAQQLQKQLLSWLEQSKLQNEYYGKISGCHSQHMERGLYFQAALSWQPNNDPQQTRSLSVSKYVLCIYRLKAISIFFFRPQVNVMRCTK